MSGRLMKLLAAVLLPASMMFGVLAQEEQATGNPPVVEALDAVTRLQIFLDKADFSPGKIDGRMGRFTLEALALYREAQGGAAISEPRVNAGEADALPVLDDLDLSSVDPLFLTYEVSEDDLKQVGDLPGGIAAQAKLKTMPYRSAAEAIAEKFHMDAGYLKELNPGKTGMIDAGDMLKVVNVEPFERASVEALKPETKDASAKTDETQADADEADSSDAKPDDGKAIMVHINTESNMLTLYEAGQLVAAYPVTVGSGQTESPEGEWKVTGLSVMPNFRHDKSMLKEGVRSDDFHMLPPGPNNPVGVIWIQLNKTGIGIHGTNDPDTIGRASSHGCIRLANWDVVRFAARIGVDVPVTIKPGPYLRDGG